MITEHDLDEAIAECKGKRRPDANDCIKLAAFYAIKNQLYPTAQAHEFAYAAPRMNVVEFPGDSEFGNCIDGKRQSEVWPVMDELMDTLSAVNPRLYEAVMRRLR